MGWFGSKDWNVVAIIFERPDLYRVNGNRGRGGDASLLPSLCDMSIPFWHPAKIRSTGFSVKGGLALLSLQDEAGDYRQHLQRIEGRQHSKTVDYHRNTRLRNHQ